MLLAPLGLTLGLLRCASMPLSIAREKVEKGEDITPDLLRPEAMDQVSTLALMHCRETLFFTTFEPVILTDDPTAYKLDIFLTCCFS